MIRPGLVLAMGLALSLAARLDARAPGEMATAIRAQATADLAEAVERHETVFWSAEQAARFQGMGRGDQPFSQALARAVFVTYHQVDHAALLDPARRGSDPAFDREALLVLDLIHGWLASLSARVVMEGRREPADVPLPDHEVVLRFLERARLPAGDDFVRHARLVGLRFLDRVGHSELVLGRPAFLDLPRLAESWSRYEAGELEPPEPDQGFPGEPIERVAAVAQEYLDRAGAVASAFSTVGDARHAGLADAPAPEAGSSLPPSLVRRALPAPPPPANPPVDPPTQAAGPGLLNLILLGGVILVGLRTLADMVGGRRPPPAEAPGPGGGAEAGDAGGPAEDFDEIREEAGSISGARAAAPALGAEVPVWLQAALEMPLGGRYRDLEVLGTGGKGTLVAAYDTRRDRRVAIQVPPPQLATQREFRERFLSQARALARLEHPGVVRIHDVPEVGEADVPVMVMELLEGEDLETRVERVGLAPTTETCQWTIQAAAGLDHAHAQGVLHRDVKPANMVLTPENRVKLRGFALVGDSVDQLSDQYALGETVYFLLSHQAPFAEGDGVRTRPRMVAGRGDGLHASVDAVFARVLHPDPTQRYGSCGDFARALLKATQGG